MMCIILLYDLCNSYCKLFNNIRVQFKTMHFCIHDGTYIIILACTVLDKNMCIYSYDMSVYV